VKDNLLLKLVSLLAAVLLAYSVNSERNTSVLSFNVPIEMKNSPDDKVLLRPARRMAQVTVRGPSFLVGPLASSPPPFKVVVPDGVGERLQVSLKPSDLPVPSMIEVLNVEPSEIDFVFEPIERREFKVEVPRRGQLNQQLTLSKVEIEPKVVTVRGPRSELRQIKFIESEPIDLEDISETTTLTLGLRSPGNQSALVTKSVSVRVGINETPRRRTFEKRPVELRTSPAIFGIGIEPTVVTVSVEGPPSVVAELDARDVIPYVRIGEAPPNEGRSVEIRVELPSGCSVSKIEPSTALVFGDRSRKSAIKAQTSSSNKRVR
jgi:YbbR domain-containing protein